MIAGRRQRSEQRSLSTLSMPADWLRRAFGGGEPGYTGKTVDVDAAMGLDTVFAAVRRRANIVGATPLLTYRNSPDGTIKERAPGTRLEKLLSNPNPVHSGDELLTMTEGHMKSRGNAYWHKVYGPNKLVKELWPLSPDRMTVKQTTSGQRLYSYTWTDGSQTEMGPWDIVHFRDFGTDGIVGLSPIGQCRQRLGIHVAQEEYQGRFYANGAAPSGVLQSDRPVGDEVFEALKEQFDSNHVGMANWSRPLLLEEGLKWESISMPLKDQEFVKQRQMSVQEVARIFDLPTWLIEGDSNESMTYTNTETRSTDVHRWYFRHTFRRIEKVISNDPDLAFGDDQGRDVFVEFNLDAVLRGDTKERYETYSLGIEKGFLTVNEVRRMENRAPLPEPAAPTTTPPAQVPTDVESQA